MTKFSVIIPLFNKENEIIHTINSVLNQTHSNFELIIVNDGSTDNSLNLVKSIDDPRIYVYSKKNEGVSQTRNLGVKKSNSNYLAFIDADDYWHPNHLETLHNMIVSYPDGNWFATSYEKKRNNQLISPMVTPLSTKKRWIGEIPDFFKNSFKDCLAWTSSVCFKKHFFQSLNGFDKTISHGEDTDLWIRAALESNLIYSTTLTSVHDLTSLNRSSIVPSNKRKVLNFEKFLNEEKQNPSLKKYLDLNRYSLAIKYKIAGNIIEYNKLKKDIQITNLTNKQRFLIQQPRAVLVFFLKTQKLLEKLGIRLSSF